MASVELLNIDCMEYMATCKDKQFDLAIVDPPYGIGGGLKGGRPFSMSGGDKWDNPPDETYFRELFLISANQIIWGGNYFKLGRTRGYVIWDKKNDGRDFSESEFAWTSFDRPARTFRYRFIGNKDTKHPTEKPIALYKWLLKNYAKEGDRIIDTHLGSGSSAIAAYDFGCEFIGCEIDKDYYEAALKRFNNYKLQQKLAFK